MATRKDAMRIMRECLDFLFGVDRSEKVLQSTMRNAAFLNRLEKNCRPQLDIFADIVSAYRDNHILLSIGELTRRLVNELRSLPLPEGDDSADSSQYIFHSQQAIIERVPAPIGKCSVSNDFIRIVQAKPPVDYIDPPSLGDGNDNADQPEEPDPEEFIETMAGEEEEEVIQEHNSILFDDNDKGEANDLDDADIESLAESDDATRKRSVSTEAIRIALKTERLRRRSTPSSTGASSAVSSRSGQSPADVQQPRRAQLNLPVPVDLNDAEIAVSLPAEQQHQNQLRDSEAGIRLSKSFSLSPAFGNVFSDNDFDDLDFGSPQFEPGAPLAATAAASGSKLSRLRLQQQEEQHQQQQEAEIRRREAEQERVKAEKDAERTRLEAELEEKRKKEAAEFEARQQKANDREKRKAEKEAERKKKEAKLEAKQKQKEAELEAERERKEAERRQKEAELEAERERKEAERRQKEAELEAERERKEAERRQKEAELEAERERQEAERKQKEELEAERERQEAEMRKEKELEAEQERREAERKQKEDELEAKRRQKEVELEAKRRQKEVELEAKRRQKEVELEAKRRQKEVELEAKREKKEAKLGRQKAELEAEQERQETERKEKENKLKADRKNNKAELEAEQESKYAKKQRVVRNSRRNRVDDDELEAEQKETSSKPIPGRKGRQLRSKPERKNDAKAANAETKSCARKRRAPDESGFLGSLRRKHKVDLDAETSNASSEEGDESNSEQLDDSAVSEPDSDRQRPPTPQPGASKSQRCSSRQGRLSSPPQSPTFFTADAAATAAAPDEFAELDRLVRERGRCLFDEEVHDDNEVPEAVVEDKASAPELVIEQQQQPDEAKEALVPPVSNNKSKKQPEKKPKTEDNNNRPARRAAAQRANVSLSATSMSQAIDQFNAGLGLGVAGDEHNEKRRRPAPTMLSKKSKITKTTRQPEPQEDKEEQQQQQQQQQQPPQESALDVDESASPVWRFNDAQSSTSPRKFFSTTFADRRRSEAKRLLTAKEQFGYKLYHLNRPANPSFNAVLKPTHNLTDPVMSKVAGQKSRKRKPQHKNSVTFCAEEDEEEADLFAEVRPRKTARQTPQRQQQTPKMRKQLDYLTMMQEDNDADADEDRRMLMNIEDDDDEVDNVDRGRRPRQSRFAGLPKPDAGTLFRMVRFRRKLVNLLDQLAAEYPQVAEAIGQIEKGEVRSVDEVVL